MINITFPDGAVREFESGVTTFEIAQSISNSLAKKALAGKFNGKLIDTTRVITEDGSIEIVTPDHEDALPILRHSGTTSSAVPCSTKRTSPSPTRPAWAFRALYPARCPISTKTGTDRIPKHTGCGLFLWDCILCTDSEKSSCLYMLK